MAISAQAGTGIKPLLFSLKNKVDTERNKKAKKIKSNRLPVIKLADTSDAYTVVKDGKVFMITGERIERFANRTDFEKEEGVQRLRDIMRRAGILHELNRQGIEAGQIIQIGSDQGNRLRY